MLVERQVIVTSDLRSVIYQIVCLSFLFIEQLIEIFDRKIPLNDKKYSLDQIASINILRIP